jgi:hypothetical protein
MGGYDKSPDYAPQGGFWTAVLWIVIVLSTSGLLAWLAFWPSAD